MPFIRSRYPKDWPAIRRRILDRDGHRCKRCGLPNHAVGWRDREGRFHRAGGNSEWDALGNGERTYAEAREACAEANDWQGGLGDNGEPAMVIVLTIAHLDHDTENNAEGNLAAWCQRCHLRHDAQQHAASRRRRRHAGQQELPL